MNHWPIYIEAPSDEGEEEDEEDGMYRNKRRRRCARGRWGGEGRRGRMYYCTIPYKMWVPYQCWYH